MTTARVDSPMTLLVVVYKMKLILMSARMFSTL